MKHARFVRIDSIADPARLAALRGCAAEERDGMLALDREAECYPALFPRHRFSAKRPAAREPATRGPGDVVKNVLSRLGYKSGADCGCTSMRRKMNEWGYLGCWKHRGEIAAWFTTKAAERGVVYTPRFIFKLLREAWRELRTKDKSNERV